MKKHLLLLAVITAIFLTPILTLAENFTVGIGPAGNIFVVDARPELKPGVGGHFFFDYRWSPQISTQFQVIVTNQDGQGISNGDDDIIFFGIPSIDMKYYLLTSESHWDPYLMIGVGFYLISEGTSNNDSTAAGFGADAGIGLDYYITEKWSLGLTAQFRSIGLIDGTTGSNNGTAIFPFTMTGNIAFHF